jgi:hypothetical protein
MPAEAGIQDLAVSQRKVVDIRLRRYVVFQGKPLAPVAPLSAIARRT